MAINGNVVKYEPVLIVGLVQALLGVLLAFGVPLSDEMVGSIMAVTAVILAIVARMLVTPVGEHHKPDPVVSDGGATPLELYPEHPNPEPPP